MIYNNKKIPFVALEGLSRTGKTTQGELIARHLKSLYGNEVEVIVTSTTEGNEFCSSYASDMKKLTQGSSFSRSLHPLSHLFGYAAAFTDILYSLQKQLDAVESTKKVFVIIDRWYPMSSFVFQHLHAGVSLKKWRFVTDISCLGMMPDLILTFTSSNVEAIGKRATDPNDFWETKGVQFFNRINDFYLQALQSEHFKKFSHPVNCDAPIQDVHNNIVNLLRNAQLL